MGATACFAGRDFASLPAMQQAAEVWCQQVAGRRACRPLGGAQPLVVFQATEQPTLLPLPTQPFELAAWSTPKVHPDCHITVQGALYSVPWRLGADAWTCAAPPGWSRSSPMAS